jgi:hypothetical protein
MVCNVFRIARNRTRVGPDLVVTCNNVHKHVEMGGLKY